MSEIKNSLIEANSDEDIREFLLLNPEERFASIVADLLKDFGLHSDMGVKHTFLDGMYMREMFIPKHSLLVGAIHKKECVNVCSQGSIIILDSTGDVFTVKAPFQAISPPGIIKMGIALEDTVWTNVFRLDEMSIDSANEEIAFSPMETMRMIDKNFKYITKEILCLS